MSGCTRSPTRSTARWPRAISAAISRRPTRNGKARQPRLPAPCLRDWPRAGVPPSATVDCTLICDTAEDRPPCRRRCKRNWPFHGIDPGACQRQGHDVRTAGLSPAAAKGSRRWPPRRWCGHDARDRDLRLCRADPPGAGHLGVAGGAARWPTRCWAGGFRARDRGDGAVLALGLVGGARRGSREDDTPSR